MKFTARDFLITVLRYSRALIAFWVVIVVAMLVFFSQTRKQYDSKAKILISLGTEALGKADYLNGKNPQLQLREQEIHNEQQILESHEVMITVAQWIFGDPTPGFRKPVMDSHLEEAKRFFTGAEPQPTFLLGVASTISQGINSLFGHNQTHDEQIEGIARQLSDDLSVNAIFDSDALDLSFRYRNPGVAQTVLKLLISAYTQHHIAVFQNKDEADLLRAQFERSVAKYHDRLAKFSSFMATHRVYNDDSQATVLVEQREKLRQALDEALADGDAAAARLASLKGIQSSLKDFERYSTTEVRNKLREALLAKLDEAAVEDRTLLTRHPKGSRAYEEEQAKIDELRHLSDQEPEHVVQETEQRKSKASEFVESELISVTEGQRGDQARIGQLRADMRNVNAEINRYATDLNGFNSLKLDVGLAKQESEQMSQAYVDSGLKTITSQHSITDISVVDAPAWNPVPASPSTKVALAATLLLLIVGSLAVLLACIGLDATMGDRATAELQLGTPVVGTIPLMAKAADEESFPARFTRDNHREFARIYQAMRDAGPEGKIILIAESSSGEGASLVGYGLARFLNRYARQRTAFIDRTVHPLNELSDLNKIEAIEPAAESSPNAEIVLAWPGEEQSIVGASAGDAVSVLLKLRREFAYTVISSGAVKDTTDLLSISDVASAAFLIVDAGKTRRAAARYSLDQLQRNGFQRIQLILNKRIFYIPGWLMRFV